MRFLWIVFAASLSLLAAAMLVPGLESWLLLAVPCLAAAAILLLKRYFGGAPSKAVAAQASRKKARRAEAKGRPGASETDYVVIDGSNVMHWSEDGLPSLAPVRLVLYDLTARGFTPGVIFDANAGYKLFDSFHDTGSFAAQLNLPFDRVFVVPKGTQADQYILEAARTLRARVVTNDRYRDWSDAFPEVAEHGFLIRGGLRQGAVWLSLPEPPGKRS